MTDAGSKKLLTAFCFLLLFYFTSFSAAFAQHLNAPPAKINLHPKISSYLQKLETEYKEGADTNRLLAQGVISGTAAPNKVSVYLMSAPGTRIDETALSGMGAVITKHYGNMVRAQIPVNILTAVADTVNGVSFIKTPDTLIPTAIESEGVNLTNADAYHNAGYDGTGVKVAVIDRGFAALSTSISNGQLPADVVKVDCTGSSCVSSSFSSETEPHGTAVAEIVHDMAPGAKLYLIKISDTLDLADAEYYVKNNGIRIVNHSLVVANTNFYDGKCWISSMEGPNAVCSADDAYDNNILWVNSAGNEARAHYEARFTDSSTPSDGWHNVSGSNETIEIYAKADHDYPIDVYLTWDAWPTTDQDYDLFLFDDSNNVVDSSTTTQSGTQPPTEYISFDVPFDGYYYLAIKNVNTTSNHLLEIYSVNHNLSPAVAYSSLLSPADSKKVLVVGAIDYRNWTGGPQEPYSSQGPTNDEINYTIKPDIMGPDHVSSSIEGVFSGTSASSPHVAGAAALILDKNPGISVSQLWNSLTDKAIDMGALGKDNIYGYGRLNLDINEAIASSTGGTSGGGGGCFIATAAYGSYEVPYIRILRKMRDRFLVTNAVGKAFVHLYYTYSPPIANIIANHNSLKIAVRIGLMPLVGISWLALKTGVLFTLFTLALVTFFMIGLVRLVYSRIIRRRGKA